MRHYNFQAPDHHTGEMLLAGYIHEKPLGLEVRGNGFAETHSMALEGAFYRVDFAGLSFIAVVAPRGGDVGCIHLESNHFGAPAFYPCSLSGDSHSSALPTAIRDDDSALPASAVYFRASPVNATAACRAAAALLSALNSATAHVPPLSALHDRPAEVLERMLASVDRLYVHEHGRAHCDPVEPRVDLNGRWERKLRLVRDPAQADCQVVVPNELRLLDAMDFRVHGGDEGVPLRIVGNVGDTFTMRLARPVGIYCEMRCTWAATYAVFPGQHSSCYEVARRLHVGLDDDDAAHAVAQAIWPEERILTRRDCGPETTLSPPPPLRVAAQRADVTLQVPFVVAATRLVDATAAEQARVHEEMATLRAKYVHVVEIDVMAPRPRRVQCGDVAVAVAWDAEPPRDEADFVVVVCTDANPGRGGCAGALVVDARVVLRGGLVLIMPGGRGMLSDARTLLVAVAALGALLALALWARGAHAAPREKEQ